MMYPQQVDMGDLGDPEAHLATHGHMARLGPEDTTGAPSPNMLSMLPTTPTEKRIRLHLPNSEGVRAKIVKVGS